MKFIEVKNRLEKMANGEYHSIKYTLTEFKHGEIEAECSVYIHGYHHSWATTWKAALDKMRLQINPPEKTNPNPVEAPGDEL